MDSNAASSPAGLPPAGKSALLGAWPRHAQLAVSFFLGVATSLLALRGYASCQWAARPTQLGAESALAYRVDLNSADHAELLQLPGVGEGLATRIEHRRRAQKGFRSIDDLMAVRGVGPATMERLRPLTRVAGEPDERAPTEPVRKPRGTEKADDPSPKEEQAKRWLASRGPVDLNRASARELEQLPGVGPKMAQRIIAERRRALFESPDALRRVKGIGVKTLERLRPYVTATADADAVAAGRE
jgi:competence protein ComEA